MVTNFVGDGWESVEGWGAGDVIGDDGGIVGWWSDDGVEAWD